MRKTFSMVLITVLLLGVLAACGSSTATSIPATTPPAAATAAAGSPATAAPAATMAPTTGGATVELPEVDAGAVTGDIISAGSSTVFPLTEAIAQRFKDEGYAGNITIDSVGTGAGFERFCVAAETDIANASRAIKDEEAASCKAKSLDVVEFRVGTDALAVVVSSKNTFAKDLTQAQLADIYSAKAKTWKDVDPSFPDKEIELFSPGTDSGTFDYFVEVIFEKKKEPILGANPQLSEDDNVLVQGVEGSEFAIGYFGYAYFEQNKDKLRAVAIEGVEPSFTTAEDGSYPLSRPLFIYSAKNILKDKPQVAAFINFYLTYVNEEVEAAGYFPASPEALDEARQHWIDATK